MVAAARGDTIRCAPYATYGTADLSKHAVKALEDRFACLLGHHGRERFGLPSRSRRWRGNIMVACRSAPHRCSRKARSSGSARRWPDMDTPIA